MEYVCGMNFETFFSIVDNMYDEILIYDRNYNIVYINQACCRHYGCRPEQMIGKSFFDFVYADWWSPSILPVVFKEKKSYAIRQNTFLGSELLTIAVPLFDRSGKVEFVVMNVRDTVNEVDLYNPQYISVRPPEDSVTLVGESPEMQQLLRLLKRVAPLNTPCIFSGEAGVGKTVMAHYLHTISPRRDKPFATFNCAGLPSSRMERELFGGGDTPGLLDKLRDGTLLLENISGLSMEAQSQLIQYLNDTRTRSDEADRHARLLASTDKNLRALIRSGQFREDLYYRLNVVEIYVPPLRKRRQDIRPLIYHFLSVFCPQYNVNRSFTEGALQTMIHADWPSNVRELRHTVERLIVTVDNPVIGVSQLPKALFGIVDIEDAPLSSESENFDARVANFEASLIHDAYQKYGSSRRIAEHLGISQTRANNLIRKYITQPDSKTGKHFNNTEPSPQSDGTASV